MDALLNVCPSFPYKNRILLRKFNSHSPEPNHA